MKEEIIKCVYCGRKFVDLCSLGKHLVKTHNKRPVYKLNRKTMEYETNWEAVK